MSSYYHVINMINFQLIHILIFIITNYITVTMTTMTTASLSYRENENMQELLLYPPDSARRFAHITRGSYFGYSIATYIGQSQPSCLVGAPKASHSSTNESTGVVYRLDMDLTFPFCSVVPIATTDALRKEVGTPTPGVSHWLGGTVAAANNAVDGIQLGCDFRYLFNSDLMNDISNDPADSGNRFKSSIKSKSSLGIGNCALYTGTSMQYVSVDPCHSQEEGACLAGFSADVQAGNQSGEAFVALGMPGSYLTEGNIFLGRYHGRELINAIRLKSSSHDLKHKGFGLGYAIALAKLNSDNNNDKVTRQHHFSHLQQQEEQQHQPQSHINIITSSPMWIDNDYRGIVMILNQAMDLGGITYLKDKWGHVGSYFGYSLAVADLDGNGLADIIVGAPYFTRHQSQETRDVSVNTEDQNTHHQGTQWSNLLPDIGRVYIFYGAYSNSSSPLSDSKSRPDIPDYFSREPVILEGPKSPKGRFGHAVSNIGDVDSDGTDDLAVSCPYCNDPNGEVDKGVVFIYLGKKDSILDAEPFQSIWPSDLPKVPAVTVCGSTDFTSDYTSESPRVFTAFGWSLSGLSDLDGNNAPDLVIGDYESDQVVMLRARNTLWFDSAEWELPTQPTLSWLSEDGLTCDYECSFPMQLSVRINGNQQLLKQIKDWKLRLMIDLDSDVEQPENKRLIVRSVRKQMYEHSLVKGVIDTLVDLKTSELADEYANRIVLFDFVVEPLPGRVSTLLWKPVRINVTLSPVIDPMSFVEHKSISSWMLHPFLGQRYFVSRSMQFSNPACGSDNICRPDLQVQMTDISEGPTDKSIIYFRERVTQRNVTVFVGNLGENAYSTKLVMTFPDQLSFSIPEGLLCETIPLSELKQTQLSCNLRDPLGYTGNEDVYSFTFQINTAGAFRQLDEPLNDQPENATSNSNNQQQGQFDDITSQQQIPDSLRSMKNKQNSVESDFNASPAPSSLSSVWSENRYYSNSYPTYESYDQHSSNRVKRSTLSIPKELTITAEVQSGNEDINKNNNKASISYKLKLAAKVELSSSALDRTIIDFRNFSVQPYEMQRIHPETIGPELKHVYLVTNAGPSPLESFWVNLTIPLQTRDGEHLVYLLDRLRYQAEDGGPPRFENMSPDVVSAEGHVRGFCITPEWALNPLRLNAVHRSRPEEFSKSQSLRRSYRFRRSVKWKARERLPIVHEKEHTPAYQEKESKDAVRTTRSILHGIRKRQQEIVKCGEKISELGYPVCAVISCHVNGLSRGDAVRIVLRGWIWADTYFRYKISDFAIISEANAQLEETAFGIKIDSNLTVQPLAISQNFVFEGINVSLFREIPLWPFILGSILGLALLALLIFTMWKCGFFHRKQIYHNQLQQYPNANNANGSSNINPIYIGPTKI